MINRRSFLRMSGALSAVPFTLQEPSDTESPPPHYENFQHWTVQPHTRIVANGTNDGFVYANATDDVKDVVLWVNDSV